MKKTIVLGMIGLAASMVSSYGQGAIHLDNYDSSGPYVTYGAGTDGTVGTGVSSAYTMGFYYWIAVGNFTGSTTADPSGTLDPATLGSYALATGAGSTAAMGYGGTGGAAYGASAWLVPITPGPSGGATLTLELIAYEGASYASALYRGHSAPFTILTSDTSSPTPNTTGAAMTGQGIGLSVHPVPEPTTLALGGLGGLALLLLRRKQS